jgi:hypothetical protein
METIGAAVAELTRAKASRIEIAQEIAKKFPRSLLARRTISVVAAVAWHQRRAKRKGWLT